MIEIKQQLNVSKEAFYKQLLISIHADYQEATKEKVSLNKIKKGLSYQKNMSTRANTSGAVTMHIEELEENKLYRMAIESRQGTNYAQYEICEIEPNKIEVRYEEGFNTSSTFAKWNHKLMSMFYARNGKKRMQNMLSAMEAYIIENGEKEQ